MTDLQGYENDGEQTTDRSRSSAMSRAVSVFYMQVWHGKEIHLLADLIPSECSLDAKKISYMIRFQTSHGGSIKHGGLT